MQNSRKDVQLVDARPRTLTDADAEAIAKALQVRLKNEFYQDLGRGVWGVVWKIIVACIIGLAAYGSSQHLGQ